MKSKSFTTSLLLSTLAMLLNPLDMIGQWSLKGSPLHLLLLVRLVGHIQPWRAGTMLE